jgi:hypothetical protein
MSYTKKAVNLLIVLSIVVSVVLVTSSLAVVAQEAEQAPSIGQNTIQNGLCGGSNLHLTSENCTQALGNPQNALNTLITRVVNLFSVIVGIVAVIMIIVGGFKYITSGGDSSNVSDAKNTILYAIVGLIIVALSQFLVRFVLSQATNLV